MILSCTIKNKPLNHDASVIPTLLTLPWIINTKKHLSTTPLQWWLHFLIKWRNATHIFLSPRPSIHVYYHRPFLNINSIKLELLCLSKRVMATHCSTPMTTRHTDECLVDNWRRKIHTTVCAVKIQTPPPTTNLMANKSNISMQQPFHNQFTMDCELWSKLKPWSAIVSTPVPPEHHLKISI